MGSTHVFTGLFPVLPALERHIFLFPYHHHYTHASGLFCCRSPPALPAWDCCARVTRCLPRHTPAAFDFFCFSFRLDARLPAAAYHTFAGCVRTHRFCCAAYRPLLHHYYGHSTTAVNLHTHHHHHLTTPPPPPTITLFLPPTAFHYFFLCHYHCYWFDYLLPSILHIRSTYYFSLQVDFTCRSLYTISLPTWSALFYHTAYYWIPFQVSLRSVYYFATCYRTRRYARFLRTCYCQFLWFTPATVRLIVPASPACHQHCHYPLFYTTSSAIGLPATYAVRTCVLPACCCGWLCCCAYRNTACCCLLPAPFVLFWDSSITCPVPPCACCLPPPLQDRHTMPVSVCLCMLYHHQCLYLIPFTTTCPGSPSPGFGCGATPPFYCAHYLPPACLRTPAPACHRLPAALPLPVHTCLHTTHCLPCVCAPATAMPGTKWFLRLMVCRRVPACCLTCLLPVLLTFLLPFFSCAYLLHCCFARGSFACHRTTAFTTCHLPFCTFYRMHFHCRFSFSAHAARRFLLHSLYRTTTLYRSCARAP